VKETVLTKIEKDYHDFGHVERMCERRLTKEIYLADLDSCAVKGRVMFLDLIYIAIFRVLEKSQVKGS
jgi:hypothetical protein